MTSGVCVVVVGGGEGEGVDLATIAAEDAGKMVGQGRT
jgi:hypothetical protein